MVQDPQSDGITLKMLLDHQRAMRAEFMHDQKTMLIQMDRRFDEFSRRMDESDKRTDRMQRNLTGQLDMIDERLNSVEIEYLPKRVTKLEEAVFASAS